MNLQTRLQNDFHLHVIGFIQLSPKVYKVKTEQGFYCLKKLENSHLETVYNHILTLKLKQFVSIIPDMNCHYFIHDKETYYLMEYLETNKEIKKELKIKTYFILLASLHKQSFFMQHIDEDFISKQKDDLFQLIQQRKNDYEKYMRQFEQMKYRSPSGWMLVLNYYRVSACFQQAYRYLNDYVEMMKDNHDIRLCLIYHHFDEKHIYVSQDKLISMDQMRIDFCIYDLYNVFQTTKLIEYLDMLDIYLEKVELFKNEKILLACLLSIVPEICFYENEEYNICQMNKVLCYMRNISSIIEKLKID